MFLSSNPITLPTWDHLAQMAKSVHSSGIDWAFIKGDHASAYKQLPLDPHYANLTIVALRGPSSGRWEAFAPRVLLFGAVSAVTHYTCFSRAVAVLLLNKYFGIPLANYYGDFGAFHPAIIAPKALGAFSEASATLCAFLNDKKSDTGAELTFLGLTGCFPKISNGMPLRICLPEDKIQKWSSIIDEIVRTRKSPA